MVLLRSIAYQSLFVRKTSYAAAPLYGRDHNQRFRGVKCESTSGVKVKGTRVDTEFRHTRKGDPPSRLRSISGRRTMYDARAPSIRARSLDLLKALV